MRRTSTGWISGHRSPRRGSRRSRKRPGVYGVHAAESEGATPTLEHEQTSIGWLRAVVSGLLVVAVAVGVLVYVPNLFLTELTALSRSGRVAIASLWFFVALGLLAWGLRRLQAHREI